MLSVVQLDDDRTLNSLILPTFNAGGQIHATIEAVERHVQRSPENWEVLFVCDGCTDGTDIILRTYAEQSSLNVRTIAIPKNRGKGYAVRVGMAEASGLRRVFTDVDLAYGLEEVDKVIAALRAGSDLAIASRASRDSEVLMPMEMLGYVFARKLQSAVFSKAVRSILGIPFRDTQAGLKGMTAAAASVLLPILTCDGFEFDCEWLAASMRLGLQVAEVPVRVRYVRGTGSTTGLSSTARMISGLFKIRRRIRGIEPAPIVKLQKPRRRAAA